MYSVSNVTPFEKGFNNPKKKTPKLLSFFISLHNKIMGTAQENFDKGVELRLQGNEAFKKQDLKQGN